MFVWCVCGLGRSYEGGLLCFRVVLGPDPLELVQVMRAQNRPITRQVIKVVHDDGDKQVDDLKDRKHVEFVSALALYCTLLFFCYGFFYIFSL